MQTETLREFIVVAKRRNISQASRELNLTRSALSKHISSLERELGFQLFDRENALELTPEGECFYACAQDILERLDEGLARCRSLSGDTAPVRVQWSGLESHLPEPLLPSVKTPFTLVQYTAGKSNTESVASGDADIAFAYNLDAVPALADELRGEGLAWTALGEEPVSILMSRENPLASKAALSRSDLRNAKIMCGFGGASRNAELFISGIVGADLDAKLVQNPSLHSTSDLLFLYLGQELFFDFRKIVHHVCDCRSDVVAVDELDGQPIVCRTYLVYRAEAQNPNVHAFVAEVEALVAGRQENEDANDEALQEP